MQPGERLAGRFEIIAEAAHGGMGTVFRARDRRDRRDVALKVLRADVVTQTHAARFAREAELLAGLHHPNIVEYISHGATPDGVRYLVMEWVDGETLAHRLAGDGISIAAAVAMAIQLCRALAALHARDVVHRDVKPSNVMLVGGAATPAVKLVDLGIARPAGDASRLTRTGAMIGTAGYLAPELVRGRSAEADGRADLFALGCVLYECLAGVAAFRGDSPIAVCAKVLVHDPPALRTLEPATPPALEALVGALLARRPDDRPRSAAEVAEALTALAAGAGLPAAPRAQSTRPVLTRTLTADPTALCGVLVEDGLAVMVAGDLAMAAQVALEIAAEQPGAQVVVAAGASADDCIDRCARSMIALEIASHGAGVWIDRGAIGELAGAYAVAVAGQHARITRHPRQTHETHDR